MTEQARKEILYKLDNAVGTLLALASELHTLASELHKIAATIYDNKEAKADEND